MTPVLLSASAVAITRRLEPTDLEVGAGELVALIGSNGGGKTSLLRALAGIERTQGSVAVAGEALESISPVRRQALLAFLPASRDIAWPIAARDVIALGAVRPDREHVDELVQLLELASFADRPVNSLSTGERARVLLARALASRPKLLLLDEPLSTLDPYWVLRIVDLVVQLVRSGACSALVSLHDLAVAEHFDRLLLIDHGQVKADGPAAEVLASSGLTTAFRIARTDGEWRIRPPADPRSSP